jgi:hypothetical protein
LPAVDEKFFEIFPRCCMQHASHKWAAGCLNSCKLENRTRLNLNIQSTAVNYLPSQPFQNFIGSVCRTRTLNICITKIQNIETRHHMRPLHWSLCSQYFCENSFQNMFCPPYLMDMYPISSKLLLTKICWWLKYATVFSSKWSRLPKYWKVRRFNWR